MMGVPMNKQSAWLCSPWVGLSLTLSGLPAVSKILLSHVLSSELPESAPESTMKHNTSHKHMYLTELDSAGDLPSRLDNEYSV